MNVLEFSKKQYKSIFAKQNDTGRTEEFQLVDNGIPIDLTGCTVTLNMKKPVIVFASCTITNAEEGKIKVSLTNSMLSQKGKFEADISIFTDAGLISSANFILEVEASQRDDTAIEAKDEISALEEALTKLNGLSEEIEEKVSETTQKYLDENSQEAGTLYIRDSDGNLIAEYNGEKDVTIEQNSAGGSSVSVTQKLTSGTEIGSVTVDGKETKLYAPSNSDSGSSSNGWEIIGDITTTEEAALSIPLSGFDYKEIEALVLIASAPTASGNIYLTSSSAGTIYGNPRAKVEFSTTLGFRYLSLEAIAAGVALAKQESNNWATGDTYDNIKQSCIFQSNVAGELTSFTECTVATDNALPAGTRVIVRGRN